MADMDNTLNKSAVNDNKKPVDTIDQGVSSKKHVGLVEMMLILMLVGLVFVFVFPMQQLKVDKALEEQNKIKVESLKAKFEPVIKAMYEYQSNDPFGAFPLAFEEVGFTTQQLNSPEFEFSYDEPSATITAKTTAAYGKAEIKINYNLNTKVYAVDDPNPTRKPVVKDEWLM